MIIINSRTKIDRSNTYTMDVGKVAEDKIDLMYEFPKILFASYEEAIGQRFKESEKLIKNNIATMREVYDMIKV